jgi:hypothetical protein
VEKELLRGDVQGTAKLIRTMINGQALYRLNPPYIYTEYMKRSEKKVCTAYIVLSTATDSRGSAETLAFPSTNTGKIVSFASIAGHPGNGTDHYQIFKELDYELWVNHE